jgi:hypothetical protein
MRFVSLSRVYRRGRDFWGRAMSAASIIRKNANEEIRIELSEFNGHDLINMRVWADPRSGGGERIPTKAGIACRVELLPDLIEALRLAESEARAKGLLPALPEQDLQPLSEMIDEWTGEGRNG